MENLETGKAIQGQGAEQLVALVYRPFSKMPCKQYPFFSLVELGMWLCRLQNQQEVLSVMPVVYGRGMEKQMVAADCVFDFVEKVLEDHGQA